MSPPVAVSSPANAAVAEFYNWVFSLYPLVDVFCSPGRLQLIGRINQLPAGRLLEIGVGPGRHLRHYERHHITAIDCSARMVSSSRRFSPASDIRQMDGEALGFPDASFDYVALFHVLSTTADPARMLAESRRVLRPGGRLFVLNHETPKNAWRHLDRALMPLARRLHFRSWFRLGEISGIEILHQNQLGPRGGFGLMTAYSLEK